MIGIYFHIPFCKSKCAYCDFFSVTSSTSRNETVAAMVQEINIRKNYFEKLPIDTTKATFYFGGGTPSLLSLEALQTLAHAAKQTFGIQEITEFTVEANPDDVNENYLQGLQSVGVNRLSIGIQSFFDEDLQFAQRRHTAQQALDSVKMAQKAGFNNISIDLMYGLPNLSVERWQKNLEIAFSLGVQHLSAYCLTIAPHTVFGRLQEQGQLQLPSEHDIVEQERILVEMSNLQGFERYEISNFALPGFYAEHNTAYWQGTPYIGIGAAAHSYNIGERQSNAANIQTYINAVKERVPFFEKETLTAKEKYNEFIFTGLRTKWGVDAAAMRQTIGDEFADYFLQKSKKLLERQQLEQHGTQFIIPLHLWIIADSLIVDLIKD